MHTCEEMGRKTENMVERLTSEKDLHVTSVVNGGGRTGQYKGES